MDHFSGIHGERLVVVSANDLALLVEEATARGVRKALMEVQDRQSFAAANDWLTQTQVEELLGRSRSFVCKRLRLRKLAETDAERDAAFPPTYQEHVGSRHRFKRSEIEAWQRSYGR
ncbi:hypothetical protein [Qipengyuania citrea]|uniref:hypothetical protein n=1 Tax=Qipengyuania citrea TaxID=225971 RepID=UPI001E5A5905|nr:hypothetical protein [Qipengyuania citrea]